MVDDRRDSFRDRLYSAYSTDHAGVADVSSADLSFRRDVLPHLPSDHRASVIDLGCGQGQVVRLLVEAGYPNASGIDVSPEQVRLAHEAGVPQVVLGDYRDGFHRLAPAAVVATDFFEHLDKYEVLEAMDKVNAELASDGVLILRVPNSVSPFAGNYRYGDLTHETSFTARSLRQLGAAAGYAAVSTFGCRPMVHGIKSAARLGVWGLASVSMKLTLAAETGQLRGHFVSQNIVAVMRKSAQHGNGKSRGRTGNAP